MCDYLMRSPPCGEKWPLGIKLFPPIVSKTASMFQKCGDWRRYHEMDERGNASNGGDSNSEVIIRSGKVLLWQMFSSDLLSAQKHSGMIHGKNIKVFILLSSGNF